MGLRSSTGVIIILIAISGARAQELPPAQADRFTQGVAALKAGDLDTAETRFRDLLRAGVERAFIRHNLGLVLRERGRHLEALAEFRAATKLEPSFGPARLLAGTILLSLGRAREAVPQLERAVQLMPHELVAHLQLADAHERTANPAGLVEAYQRIVALAPEEPEYVYRLGRAHLTLSQWAHERIRSIDPESARLRQALGREYLQQQRPDLAAGAFEEAARLNPALPEIHLALARIHFDEGRLDEAAREVASELALEPESQDARTLKASIEAARSKR